MMKGAYLLLLIAVANGSDLERIVGNWTLLTMFPNSVFYPACMKATISNENRSVKCSCGGEEAEYPIVHSYLHPFQIPYVHDKPTDPVTKLAAVKFIDDYSISREFLKKNCTCEGSFERPELIRFLNDNYIVYYELLNHPYFTENEPNTALLSSKLLPTRGELRDVVIADSELKSRDAGLLCQDLKY